MIVKCPHCEQDWDDPYAMTPEESKLVWARWRERNEKERAEKIARGEHIPTGLEISYSMMNAPNPMWETIERLRKEEEAKEAGK